MDGIQPEQINEIIEELLHQNYSKDNIIKILGGNFLRVASAVWK